MANSASPLARQLQFCEKKIVYEIMKKKEAIAWFNKPVDVNAYPAYALTISKPMDFGTIRLKLQKGSYSSVQDFAADMRLVFKNCYTFNGEPREDLTGSVSHDARKLEKWFEEKFKQVPHVLCVD
eukprot:Colp12_sorted_trinity150504_noHs@33699